MRSEGRPGGSASARHRLQARVPGARGRPRRDPGQRAGAASTLNLRLTASPIPPEGGAGSADGEPGAAGSHPEAGGGAGRGAHAQGREDGQPAASSAAPTSELGRAGAERAAGHLPAAHGLCGRVRTRPQSLPEEERGGPPRPTPPPAAPARGVRTPPPVLIPEAGPDPAPTSLDWSRPQPPRPNLALPTSRAARPRPSPLLSAFAGLPHLPPIPLPSPHLPPPAAPSG